MEVSPDRITILKYIESITQGWRDTYETEKKSNERDKGKKALAIAQSQVAVRVLEDLIKDIKSGSYIGVVNQLEAIKPSKSTKES